jgi:hypothetical protein
VEREFDEVDEDSLNVDDSSDDYADDEEMDRDEEALDAGWWEE